MNNLEKLNSAFTSLVILDDEIKVHNPVVIAGMEDFVQYCKEELEEQDKVDFELVSIESFNKLSVNLFDSGMVVSILDTEFDEDIINLSLSIVDIWDDIEGDDVVSVELDLTLNQMTGEVVLSSRIDFEESIDTNQVVVSALGILGIKDEEANLVVPQADEEIMDSALVIKERLMYLIGEAFVKFGTRWRKMINPITFAVEEDSEEVIMPEFPGETSVLLFGLFLIEEASRLNDILQGEDDPEEDDEDQESGFGFLRPEPDERPVEERLKEAIAQAAGNKTLH